MYSGRPEAASIGGLFYSKRERQMSLAKFLIFVTRHETASSNSNKGQTGD
jgi:hypothetical protein